MFSSHAMTASRKNVLLPHIALWILAFAVMAPVLVHPHWGMFSDAGQIVRTGRGIYDNAADLSRWFYTICADYRPGFHIINMVLWPLSGHQPFCFYLFRCLCCCATLSLTYSSCMLLSKSRLVSFVLTLFWLMAYPTIEVLYTLDKGELYIGGLFALIVYVQLHVESDLNTMQLSSQRLITAAGIAFAATMCLVFTKQTGQLIIVYGFLLVFGSIINGVLLPKADETSSARMKQLLGTTQFKWRAFLCACFIVAVLCFKAFTAVYHGVDFKYTHTILQPAFIWSHLLLYAQGLPEFFLLLACTIGGLSAIATGIIKTPVAGRGTALNNAICLTLTTICGAGALCAWESDIGYIWYPLLALLLPSFAFVAGSFPSQLRKVAVIGCCLLILLLVPSRLSEARTQFQMDLAFNNMIEQLAKMPPSVGQNTNVVLNLRTQISEEIGEEVKNALATKLSRETAASPDDLLAKLDPSVNIWNMIRDSNGDRSPTIVDGEITSKVGYLPEYVAQPGLNKYRYLENHQPAWMGDNLNVGDILLVPYGKVKLTPLIYRGFSIFVHSWEAVQQSMLQLDLTPVFIVEKSVSTPFDPQGKTLGWAALRVNKAPQFTLPLDHFGWLPNHTKISYNKNLQGHVLVFSCKGTFVPAFIAVEGKRQTVVSQKKLPESFDFEIPLTDAGEVQLNSESTTFPKKVMLRVNSVFVK